MSTWCVHICIVLCLRMRQVICLPVRHDLNSKSFAFQPCIHVCVDKNISGPSCCLELPSTNFCDCRHFDIVSHPHFLSRYDRRYGIICWVYVIYALQGTATKDTEANFNFASHECCVSKWNLHSSHTLYRNTRHAYTLPGTKTLQTCWKVSHSLTKMILRISDDGL